jgi:tetratricopeptide (TPR) repeat protein
VGNQAIVDYFRGDFAASTTLSRQMFESAKRREDAHNQAWALRSEIYCLLPKGEYIMADAHLTGLATLLERETRIVDQALRIDMYGLLALVKFRLGQIEAALAAGKQATALMAQTSPVSYLSLPGYASTAQVYLRLWEAEYLARQQVPVSDLEHAEFSQPSPVWTPLAREACKFLRGYARVFPIGKSQARLWQGLFEWQSGRRRLALEYWRNSLTAARQLAMPFDEGLVHFEIGRHLPSSNPQRAQHLAQAQEIFEWLQATDLKDQVVEVQACTVRH